MIDLRSTREPRPRSSETLSEEIFGGAQAAPIGIDDEDDFARPTTLREVPPWPRDIIGLSQRARRVLDSLRFSTVVVIGYFDHVRRAISIGDRTLTVDAAGCYRLR